MYESHAGGDVAANTDASVAGNDNAASEGIPVQSDMGPQASLAQRAADARHARVAAALLPACVAHLQKRQAEAAFALRRRLYMVTEREQVHGYVRVSVRVA